MTTAQVWSCRNNMKHTHQVCEPEFGSSTSMEFGVEDEVSSVEDTSPEETNYFWNHWSSRELNSKGMSLREAFQMLSPEFDDEDGKYRHPLGFYRTF